MIWFIVLTILIGFAYVLWYSRHQSKKTDVPHQPSEKLTFHKLKAKYIDAMNWAFENANSNRSSREHPIRSANAVEDRKWLYYAVRKPSGYPSTYYPDKLKKTPKAVVREPRLYDVDVDEAFDYMKEFVEIVEEYKETYKLDELFEKYNVTSKPKNEDRFSLSESLNSYERMRAEIISSDGSVSRFYNPPYDF